jgi:hypothetical protein
MLVTQETIKATNEKRIAYFADLKEKPLNRNKIKAIKIQPEDIKIGDMIANHGCIFQVTEIKQREYCPDVLNAFVISGLYVCGDLEMYKWFLKSCQNGCAKSHFTSKQGNARANWTKVEFIHEIS